MYCRLLLLALAALTAPGCSCTPSADPVRQSTAANTNDETNSEANNSDTENSDTKNGEAENSDAASDAAENDMPAAAAEQGDAAGAENSARANGADSSASAADASPAAKNSTTKNSPSSSLGSQRPATPALPGPKLSPAQAAREAEAALATALKQERGGDPKKALETALRGYQTAHAHREDPACQQAAGELLEILERLGESQSAGQSGALQKPYRID
jgi:hypothetical protein